MTERPNDLTPGDPLEGRRSTRPSDGLWSAGGAPAWPAEGPASEPVGGYAPGSAVPPGAGGGPPVWQPPASPAVGRRVLAGWWRRAGANLIDVAIISVISLLLLVPFGAGFATVDSDTGAAALIGALAVTALVFALAALLYAPLMLWKTNGKTVGRMATGIRVVRASGEPMTLGVALLREVVLKALVFGLLGSATFSLAYLLDVLWPLWDEQKRALHDFPVNTRTVRG